MTRDDGTRSYALAIAALREKCVRAKQVAPIPGDADEARAAAAKLLAARD